MKGKEANLQASCFKWFNLQYPQYRGLLFAIPNGGSRNYLEAINLKKQGVVAGVSDLFLAVPNKTRHGFFIELKSEKGILQETQKEFQDKVKKQGYTVMTIYSFDEFEIAINMYFLPRTLKSNVTN